MDDETTVRDCAFDTTRILYGKRFGIFSLCFSMSENWMFGFRLLIADCVSFEVDFGEFSVLLVLFWRKL